MMKSLLSCTCTTGMVLKGSPLRPLRVPKGGVLFGHHLQGVELCLCIASQGGLLQVIRGGQMSGHLICS